MNYNDNHIPVIIAGGGPSGAATALSLRGRGIDCLVAEAAPEPRFKAGETVPPNALPLFKRLGIAGLLDHPLHLQSYGNRFAWGSSEPLEKDFVRGYQQNGWHLDRAFFEAQLQRMAINAGAKWQNGTRITACAPEGTGWHVTLTNTAGNTRELSSSFLVDATGRAARIARQMGISRQRMDNLAGMTVCLDMDGMNSPLYTFVEAQPNGWWYAAPLTNNRMVTTFMTDSDLMPPELTDPAHYLKALRQTAMLNEILPAAHIAGHSIPITLTAATSYLSERHGTNWLAVGDAAFAYDPLSSYGITSALEGGFYAGHAIADTLAGEPDALTAYDYLLCQAFTTYKDMRTHQYQLETRWAGEEFWRRRGVQHAV